MLHIIVPLLQLLYEFQRITEIDLVEKMGENLKKYRTAILQLVGEQTSAEEDIDTITEGCDGKCYKISAIDC
jgi:hypothetical protein